MHSSPTPNAQQNRRKRYDKDNEETGWEKYLGLAFTLFFVAIATGHIIAWSFLIILIAAWLYKINQRTQTRSRCKHGIKDARFNHNLCPICAIEREVELKNDAVNHERALAELKQRQEAERQRKEFELKKWTANIRLPTFLIDMDPYEFENLICTLFEKMGYTVERTKFSGDSGSDGFAFRGEEKLVIQSKRTKNKVGEPYLRDLFGTMHASKCTGAVIATTGGVSSQAKLWTKGKPIRIIELAELCELMRQYVNESNILPTDYVPRPLKRKV